MTTMRLTSTTFDEGDTIPRSAAHPSVGGDNVSPDLAWEGIPDGTAALAVTCYDPDAPTTVGFCHWLLAKIDPASKGLAAGAGAAEANPPGSVHGITDFGDAHYGGMAPPAGDDPHHYQFTLWALDTGDVDVDATTTYAKFRFLTNGHVLASATLTGMFKVEG